MKNNMMQFCMIAFLGVSSLIALAASMDGNLKGDVPDVNIRVIKHTDKECLRKSKKHDVLVLHYEGMFPNGTKFDSRYGHVIIFYLMVMKFKS